MSQPLLIEHRDGVDWVTLNRPDSLNALDPALMQDDGLHPVASAEPKVLDTVWQQLQRLLH